MLPFPNAAYGPTKAMAHWLTKAIHIEEPELTAFPIDPGYDFPPPPLLLTLAPLGQTHPRTPNPPKLHHSVLG